MAIDVSKTIYVKGQKRSLYADRCTTPIAPRQRKQHPPARLNGFESKPDAIQWSRFGVPLTDFPDPPETMMQRCREAIEQRAPPGEKANLLAVTQVLTYLRHNDVGLLTVLGGRKVMLESPLMDELVMEKYGELLSEKIREAAREATRKTACETAHQALVTVLEARFGDVPRDVAEDIESVVDGKQLKGLLRTAVACPDLDAFRGAMARS